MKKILYNWFKQDSNSARKYIEQGIINGFLGTGNEVTTWDGDFDELRNILKEFKPDLFYGHTRNSANYNNAKWILQPEPFDLLNNYRKKTGMKVVMESHPDIKSLFQAAKVSKKVVENNQSFYNQNRHGTPAECKLVDNKFVDIITHIWNKFTTDVAFKWWQDKGVEVIDFPLAFDSDEYFSRTTEYDIDISFVGGWWPFKGSQLDKFIKPMSTEFGERLEVYGRGWPYKSRGYVEDGVVNRIFNRSKINLCIHEPIQLTPQPMHVSERIFKVCGVGGFAISDHNECIKEYFKTGEYVMASTPKEMIELTHYYLDNPDKREKIAKKAMCRVMDDHTYKKRTNDLMNKLWEK